MFIRLSQGLSILLVLAASIRCAPLHASGPVALIDPGRITSQTIDPAETCLNIQTSGGGSDQHLFLTPPASQRKSSLVLFLGGSRSSPSQYQEISLYAARLGYGVLNLSYETGLFSARLACGVQLGGSDACYANYRGESVYGEGVAYQGGSSQQYVSSKISVAPDDSVVNRLVCALQYLKRQADTAGNMSDSSYFASLLDSSSSQAAASPYPVSSYARTAARTPSYPIWSRIIVSGHSQGGGSAAFLAMTLPADTPVQRVVMFSAPNDHVTNGTGGGDLPASWIPLSSTTPTIRFFGLRHTDEGSFGNNTEKNWTAFGGTGVGYPDSTQPESIPYSSDLDATIALGSHQLTIANPVKGSNLDHHNTTAADCPKLDTVGCASVRQRTVMPAWNYLFTGGYSSD